MTIDTQYIDSDADSIKAARATVLAMANAINSLETSTGAGSVGFSEAIDHAAGSVGNFLNSLAAGRKNATLIAEAMLAIRAGTAKIVCQGDSLTYGHDSISEGTVAPVSPHVFPHVPIPYPEKLASELNRIYCVSGITVENLGYSGDTAKTSFERWTVNPGADLAFLMLATNDAKVGGITISDYVKYMSKIIEQYVKWGTGVVIITSPSIGQGYGDTPIESYRAASASLAARYSCPILKSDVIDLNNAFADVHSDSVHFNQAGYTLFGNAVAAFVTAGGLGENPVSISAEKTLLFGLESAVVSNGTFLTNTGSNAAQGLICSLAEGSGQKASIAFYLDADAAYVSLVGRLSIGSVVTIDSDSIRGVITREGYAAETSNSYTVQINSVRSEPTNDLFLGQVVGRGWHSITISAPIGTSTTPVYLNALRIAPRSQDDCYAGVYQVTKRSFSIFDPVPQYVGGLLPASSTATFSLPGALFASLFAETTAYYMSAFVEVTICQMVSGVPSYSRYIVRLASASTLSATLISSTGLNPVLIASVTSTSVLNYPGGTVTFNLTRSVAGYMEMRFDIPDVPQLLNAALM